MMRKPLVLDGFGQKQRLQPGEDLDIPLAQEVDELKMKLNTLVKYLLLQGVELPDELTNEL